MVVIEGEKVIEGGSRGRGCRVTCFCFCDVFMSGNWIRERFETPGVMSLPYNEKRTLLARLVRATK